MNSNSIAKSRVAELSQRKHRIVKIVEQELELFIEETEAAQRDPLLQKYEDIMEDRGYLTGPETTDNDDATDSSSLRRSHNRRCDLPVKVFKARASLLTTLLQNPHINSFRNIFLAILVIFSSNTLFSDVLNHGSIFNFYHLNILLSMFDGFSHVIIAWAYMFLFTLLAVYMGLTGYAQVRWNLCRRSKPTLLAFDLLCLAAVLAYGTTFAILPARYALEHELPPVCMIILLCEQVRFLMKTYAFSRECVGRIVHYQSRTTHIGSSHKRSGGEDESTKVHTPNPVLALSVPDFSCYLYFLFAPTLVYCDSYPRTATIRWNVVFREFSSVFICVVYVYYAYFRYLYETFHNFRGGAALSFNRFVADSFACMLPGSLMLFVGFFALLHSWMNAFAEMLRFGDRLFYKDWWTATSFSAWYRTWNVIVHDWLYMYVYRDVALLCRSKALATTAVFALSAIFHEYILTLAFGFFYPVLLFLFGSFGFLFTFVRSRAGVFNIGVWVALFMGMGVLTLLYTMEWYARRNCPPTWPQPWDFVTPRTWTCLRMDAGTVLSNTTLHSNANLTN